MGFTPRELTLEKNQAADLYLDLLARVLTATLYDEEPDHDTTDGRQLATAFTLHYMRGNAVTMVPRVRLQNVHECIRQVMADSVPGDCIETGVWRGGGCIFMRAALNVYGGADRTVWVADSFEGMPKPDAQRHPEEAAFFESPMMQHMYKRLEASLDEVKRNFAAYGFLDSNVQFLKGWFKDTLPSAPIRQLAVMRLDGDYYDSTMDVLTSLYRKVSPGGFVIVDDYGEQGWANCRGAIDDFRRANGISSPLQTVDSKCVFWRKTS